MVVGDRNQAKAANDEVDPIDEGGFLAKTALARLRFGACGFENLRGWSSHTVGVEDWISGGIEVSVFGTGWSDCSQG